MRHVKRRGSLGRRASLVALLTFASMVATPATGAWAEQSATGGPWPAKMDLGAVAVPRGTSPGPQPKAAGTVPVKPTLSLRAGAKGVAGAAAADGAAAPGAAPAASTAKVALRALVVAVDNDDFGVATWSSVLDRVGAAYDVITTKNTTITKDRLVRSDGVGKYNAILLTSGSLLVQKADSTWTSALGSDGWNVLWAYERDFGVRQVSLYTSPGTYPEDYCLRASSEVGTGDTALPATFTAAGKQIFDYLNTANPVPLTQSYVYKSRVEPGCSAQPILTNGADVLGVQTTSTDGRERLALTFSSNQYLLQANLLTYGMVKWATRGLFLGEQRHFINIDVDDWFSESAHMLTNGKVLDNDFLLSAADAFNIGLQMGLLRGRNPLVPEVSFVMAMNAAAADPNAPDRCNPEGGPSELTSMSRCLQGFFVEWLNHTYSHEAMNQMDYKTAYKEITENLKAAKKIGLAVDPTILKTPEYSGLGVYNPNRDSVSPPTDFGLKGSNGEMLRAAKDAGVKYVHGNMSFASHQPSCFNCNVVHPLEPSISVVPDWPVNIAYFVTNAAEETVFYNSYYGPKGKFPFYSKDLTYSEIIEAETDVALSHMATGSVYTHTFHVPNVHNYETTGLTGGKTLLSDWANRLLQKYSQYYSVPVLSPTWAGIAAYSTARNAHFAAIKNGLDAVYDPAKKTVTVTAPAAATVTISGVRNSGATTYGPEISSSVSVRAKQSVTVAVA